MLVGHAPLLRAPGLEDVLEHGLHRLSPGRKPADLSLDVAADRADRRFDQETDVARAVEEEAGRLGSAGGGGCSASGAHGLGGQPDA